MKTKLILLIALIVCILPCVQAITYQPLPADMSSPLYGSHPEYLVDGSYSTGWNCGGNGSAACQFTWTNATYQVSSFWLTGYPGDNGIYWQCGDIAFTDNGEGWVDRFFSSPQIGTFTCNAYTDAAHTTNNVWARAKELGINVTGFASIEANFTATPTMGQAPLYVAMNDTSTGGGATKTYNWTVDPSDGVIGSESTSAYPTIVFTQNGNYTVSHCVTDGTLSDCEEKTDHIWVYNSTATTTTTFWAVDPLGHRVWDSAISLQDVGNSSWTNTSSPSGGVATIVSLFGHSINGYATAAGYNDGETLGITADGVSGGIILMTPTNITNVSSGYVTLYVYVKESVGNAPISGAYVNLAYEEGGSTRNDGSTTSTEGVASFVVPNNTLIYVYGEKAGYERVSTTKDSGPGSGGDAAVSVIMYMTGQYVTPTVTATTGPGGTVPVTVDPRTPREKESDIALILIDYGDMLVMFFIALTVIGGVKMIMK